MTLTSEPTVGLVADDPGILATEVAGVGLDDADDLGARLLESAAQVFAERGYEKAGVAEIARRAGVTTGAIYARYPGKAELLVEAIDPHAGDELDALFADHRFQGHMSDILVAAGSGLVEGVQSDSSEWALLFESFAAARRHRDVADVLKRRVLEREARLVDIVEAAKADGGIDNDIDTTALVLFCHAVGFGFVLIDALGLTMPEIGSWNALINRLVEALGERPDETSAQHHKGESRK